MFTTLLTTTLILFLIMDPFGNISSYLTLVENYDDQKRKRILVREMIFVLIAMLVFNYLGEYILWILGLDIVSAILSSGLILFLTAIKILFASSDSPRANLPKGEPYVIPLAIPLIAGPSLLATIMLFALIEPSMTMMLLAILISWFAASAVLFFAVPLRNFLGKNGLVAFERVMGMILVLLAIQRIGQGIQAFISTYGS